MEYEYSLTVTAGTTQASPVSVDCQLTKGIIHHYEIVFPEGCNNMVSITVHDGGFQCFPLNPDGAIKGNADPVEKTTYYPLVNPPFKLKVKGWAPDTTYDHVILLRFDVLPEEYFAKVLDTEALGLAIADALSKAAAGATEELKEKVEEISELVIPQPVPEEEIPQEEPEISGETSTSVLDKLTPISRAVLEAQIRQGYSNARILEVSPWHHGLPEETFIEIIGVLRSLVEEAKHA